MVNLTSVPLPPTDVHYRRLVPPSACSNTPFSSRSDDEKKKYEFFFQRSVSVSLHLVGSYLPPKNVMKREILSA